LDIVAVNQPWLASGKIEHKHTYLFTFKTSGPHNRHFLAG